MAREVRNVLARSKGKRHRRVQSRKVAARRLYLVDVVPRLARSDGQRSRRARKRKVRRVYSRHRFGERHFPRQRVRLRRRRNRVMANNGGQPGRGVVHHVLPGVCRRRQGVARHIRNVLPRIEGKRHRRVQVREVAARRLYLVGGVPRLARNHGQRSRRSGKRKVACVYSLHRLAKRHLPRQFVFLRRRRARIAPCDRREFGRRVVYDVRPGSGRIRQGIARHIRNVLALSEGERHRRVQVLQVAARSPYLVDVVARLPRNHGQRSRRSGKRKVARVYSLHRLAKRHLPRQFVRLCRRRNGNMPLDRRHERRCRVRNVA